MLSKTFNQDVKALRKKLGYSQAQMAEEVGVDVITISRWERGLQRPSKLALRVLNRLANKKGGNNANKKS